MINVYKGPKKGYTVIKLTDGSTVGAQGDIEDYINLQIFQGRVITINNSDGTKIVIHPNHIVYALYTEPKEDNDG